ncbi:MAG: glycosyltransferase [Candidatus Omnitrophica bacterium]|nr:glycosyltransferase [Candidatus Omnitrophota bacterium]
MPGRGETLPGMGRNVVGTGKGRRTFFHEEHSLHIPETDMRILFVNMYPGDSGGVEYYITALARKLGEMGHFCSMVHGGGVPGDTVFRECRAVPELWRHELVFATGTREKLDAVMEELAPDIVYLHNIENAGAIRYFAGRSPSVKFVHGYKSVDPDGKMLLYGPLEANRAPLSPSCFIRAFTRKSMPRSPVKAVKAYLRASSALKASSELPAIIAASGHMKQVLADNGLEEERISVIPYFTDLSGVETRSGCSGPLLFAGRLAEGKGLDVLLEVLSLIEGDVSLDVVGDGPEKREFSERSREMGLSGRVRCHGWSDHFLMGSFYDRCSLLVLPSVWPEPFGICGIEAAVRGKPAVAFDVGGVSDWLIDGETGFLIEPYNRKKMAEKIFLLLSDPGLRKAMGERAREKALEKYAPSKHIERLMGVFREVVGS